MAAGPTPEPASFVLTSVARVATDSAGRYAKQLLSHMGHKVRAETIPGHAAPAGRLLFGYGVAAVMPDAGELVLKAMAADPESLARVQDIVARHLVRFSSRAGLTVSWGAAMEERAPVDLPTKAADVPDTEPAPTEDVDAATDPGGTPPAEPRPARDP